MVTQIHVDRAWIAITGRTRTAKSYAATQCQLARHIRAEYNADRVSGQTLLREELNEAVAIVRKLLAEANLQCVRAALAAAVGIDPPTYPTTAERRQRSTLEFPPLQGLHARPLRRQSMNAK